MERWVDRYIQKNGESERERERDRYIYIDTDLGLAENANKAQA